MAKSAHYSSVKEWVAAEFSITSGDAGGLNEQTLSKVGQVLRKVHPNSPAGLLGLKVGDILHAVNGGIFDIDDLNKTLQPRKFGRSYTFDFLRPSSRQKLRVKSKTFPFGAQYGQTVESFSVDLRNGNPDPHDVSQFWISGDEGALAELWPYFEAYNLRLLNSGGAPYDGALPQTISSTAPLAHETVVWPGHFTWLALCAAHAGQWERAQRVLETVEDHFDHSGDSGLMSMFAAMATIRSMLAENRGFIEKAVEHIEHAIKMSPETEVLYRRLSKLTHQQVSPPPSPFLGVKPHYDFPRQDPSQKFTQSPGRISLESAVKTLSAGEFILVCVMGSYRTNGPYVQGFERAHIPLARLNTRFKEVHILTSWNKVTSRDLPHWPAMEPKLQKSGVSVSLLFDEEDTLSQQLNLISAPTNLVVDHTGTVVATGWLGDDEVLWKALAL